MGKNKTLLFSVLILLLLLILALFLKEKIFLNNGIKKNTPEIEELVNISQAEISAFVFATQESEHDHRLHINLTPFVTIDIGEKEIESFVIENFVGESASGDVLLIHPTDLDMSTIGRTFLFTDNTQPIINESIISLGNTIQYKVVSQPSKFNDIASRGSVSPYFGIIVRDIGTVDYKSILERDDVFEGSKYLEYCGISLESLTTDISFDIYIKFTDGSTYFKRLKGVLDGTLFGSETTFSFTLEEVE